ncbi:MAG: hypothetical protein FJ265_10205 [Planctomycetes bacterium]|nr:hypothetical protein [Planctomycetota bacterium]
MKKSYKSPSAGRRVITVRLPLAQLRRVMRARRIPTQSELLQRLLDEADERIAAEAALRATTGVAGKGAGDFDDRLL